MNDTLRNLFAPIIALILGILKTITRVTSFFGKEVTEVWRRPGVLVSLVVGPFLIMVLFGVGYSGRPRPLEAVIVVPPGGGVPQDAQFYQQLAGVNVHVVGITDDVDGARAELQQQRVDLVVVVPTDLEARFQSGEQSVITVEYNKVDPVQDNYVRLVAQQQVAQLNQAILEQVVAQGQQYAVQTLNSPQATRIPPQVVAAPIRPQTENLAPTSPSMEQFYAPAVLALVLQHMGVTLTALSIVRERLSGAMDVFRVAPVRTLEILAGKYLAYGFLNLLVAALVLFLMVFFLRVPAIGNLGRLAGIVALLSFASLGLGLLISTVADSERQAVQLSMLVLLASVFLSGFVLPLDQFIPWVRDLAYVLPVTHGIQLMQDNMLRGYPTAPWELWALGGIGVFLFLLDAYTLRRDMSGV